MPIPTLEAYVESSSFGFDALQAARRSAHPIPAASRGTLNAASSS